MVCYVSVSGGFGNQLFCYALGRHLQLTYGCEVLYDVSSYHKPSSVAHNRLWLDRLGLPVKTTILSEQYLDLLRKTKFLPPAMQRLLFAAAYLKYKPSLRTPVPASVEKVFFTGCWQDLRSFEPSSATIRQELIAAIGTQESPSLAQGATVAVHVRRGDYLTHKSSAKIDYPVLLEQARPILCQRLGGAPVHFLVFSDDMPWCEQHLAGPDISYSRCSTMLDDFRTMLGCSHFVIANSTFSWWAAFLSPAPTKIVLLPTRWHAKWTAREAGLVAPSWIEVDDLVPAKFPAARPLRHRPEPRAIAVTQ